MLSEMDMTNIDIDKIKEKMCSQIKIKNIEIVKDDVIQKYDSFVKRVDDSTICIQERFPIRVEIDRNYCFDEKKFQERVLKVIEFSSEFITEDINNFIKKHNCQKMLFRNFNLSYVRDYCNGHYNVNIAARIMFIVDKQ